MNMFSRDNPEFSQEAATNKGTKLERVRQLVDDAFGEAGYAAEVLGKDEQLPQTPPVPVNQEGEVIDEAKRQRIIAAEAAVDAAYETDTIPKPEPSQLEDVLLG